MVLKQMNIKFLPNGKRLIFSVKFVSKEGKLRYFPKAFATGLPYNLLSNRQIGVQACDCSGNPEGHIVPVSWDRIIMYDECDVIL